jgi:hypothetical protein
MYLQLETLLLAYETFQRPTCLAAAMQTPLFKARHLKVRPNISKTLSQLPLQYHDVAAAQYAPPAYHPTTADLADINPRISRLCALVCVDHHA